MTGDKIEPAGDETVQPDELDAVDKLDETPESVEAEVVEIATETDSAPAIELEKRPKLSWPRRVLAGAVVVLFIAALVVSGVFGWMLWQQRQLTTAADAAQQAAVNYAQILTSIESDKVDENFDQVLEGATGEFKDMYSQSSTQLRQLLIDNKASAHGVVVESAVQSKSTDEVVVLLFVDQSVSNTNVPDPRIDRSRIKMTMQHVDGQWRAAKVELP